MKNVLSIVKRDECCGCTACSQVCPQSIIEIKSDHEGFLVPNITEQTQCIECGLCLRVCPTLSTPNYKAPAIENSFVVHTKDFASAKRSASGGAFWTIAAYFIQSFHAVVFGASYTQDLRVCHTMVESLSDLCQLQNSKYVQSDLSGIYREVLAQLKIGRYVLFSGTPCQIDGLYRFLQNREYPTLFTMDIVCHGVPSPLFLQKHLESLPKVHGRGVSKVQFRSKNPLFKSTSKYVIKYTFGTSISFFLKYTDDFYFSRFIKGVAFRESCYQCPYARLERVSDFTIGDCDSSSEYPGFLPGLSKSILLCNTEKALTLWGHTLSSLFYHTKLDLEKESLRNSQLRTPFKRPMERDSFYTDYLSSPPKGITINRAFLKKSVKGALLTHLPSSLLSLVSLRRIFH